MTDDEIDRLIGYAEGAYRKVINHNNVGLAHWTQDVFTAMKFIPTLVTIIDNLRGELIVSRSNEGGHIEAVGTADGLTRVKCSTCDRFYTITYSDT